MSNKRYFALNLYLHGESFSCYYEINLFVSSLSKYQRSSADLFFLLVKDFFLGSKVPYAALSPLTPSAGHTSSHSVVLVLLSLKLPGKPDWGTGPSNFLSTLFFFNP